MYIEKRPLRQLVRLVPLASKRAFMYPWTMQHIYTTAYVGKSGVVLTCMIWGWHCPYRIVIDSMSTYMGYNCKCCVHTPFFCTVYTKNVNGGGWNDSIYLSMWTIIGYVYMCIFVLCNAVGWQTVACDVWCWWVPETLRLAKSSTPLTWHSFTMKTTIRRDAMYYIKSGHYKYTSTLLVSRYL